MDDTSGRKGVQVLRSPGRDHGSAGRRVQYEVWNLRLSTDPSELPLLHGAELAMFAKVSPRPKEVSGIITKKTDGSIAAVAQETTNLPGFVAVIDSQVFPGSPWLATDGTSAVLCFEKLEVLIFGDSEVLHQKVLSSCCKAFLWIGYAVSLLVSVPAFLAPGVETVFSILPLAKEADFLMLLALGALLHGHVRNFSMKQRGW